MTSTRVYQWKRTLSRSCTRPSPVRSSKQPWPTPRNGGGREIPAANGHGNAHAAALVQSIVANGGELNGTRFLSKETLDLIFEEQSSGVDLVLGLPVTFGIGYGLANPVATPFLPERRICYWGGWGGSMVIVDTERHMVFTYMMNKMRSGLLGDLRGVNLAMAAFAAV